MDPCAFVRITVEKLLLKLPVVTRPNSGAGVHPSTSPCFCSLQLQDSPSASKTTPLTLACTTPSQPEPSGPAQPGPPVVFSLEPGALNRYGSKPAELVIAVYVGQTGSTCGMSAARALGRVRILVDVKKAGSGEEVVAQSGWVGVGKAARLHVVVRAEPDPRYVFQFGGEPECSPVVYQIPAGSGRGGGGGGGQGQQPVFSCRFSADRRRNSRSSSLASDSSTSNNNTASRKLRSWLSSLRGDHNPRLHEQRKGWTVTIHDLSGSPVAAASMVTPFVPSPGSGRVSRANPGSWLILQAIGTLGSSDITWKPWARLEAWRERGPVDALGYRLELDAGPTESPVPIAESSISVRKGGRFVIDPAALAADVSAGLPFDGGFVMGSTVEGEGKVSKPTVQVGVRHVTCMADVAVFVALAAAVDLSMDACQLFSQKLRKELRQDKEE